MGWQSAHTLALAGLSGAELDVAANNSAKEDVATASVVAPKRNRCVMLRSEVLPEVDSGVLMEQGKSVEEQV